MGEIFLGLNFCRVKFSWLKPPIKICCHKNFATLTLCVIERWLLSSEKSYSMHMWIPRLQQHMGSCCWRNAGLRDRAEEHSWQECSGGKKKKDGTVIGHLPKFRGCKIFVSLIFVTRKIFNTTKISAYTVFVFFFYIIYHIAGNIGGELNLADWRFGKETARWNFANPFKSTIVTSDCE